MKNNELHNAISKLLTDKLNRRINQKLDKDKCIEIYQDIFYTLSEVIKESQTPLENESVNLLAQMYYDSIKINGTHELDPNIFTQRAKIENIQTKELALLATMMNGTPYGDIFIHAVKRRS